MHKVSSYVPPCVRPNVTHQFAQVELNFAENPEQPVHHYNNNQKTLFPIHREKDDDDRDEDDDDDEDFFRKCDRINQQSD